MKRVHWAVGYKMTTTVRLGFEEMDMLGADVEGWDMVGKCWDRMEWDRTRGDWIGWAVKGRNRESQDEA